MDLLSLLPRPGASESVGFREEEKERESVNGVVSLSGGEKRLSDSERSLSAEVVMIVGLLAPVPAAGGVKGCAKSRPTVAAANPSRSSIGEAASWLRLEDAGWSRYDKPALVGDSSPSLA